MALTLEQKVAWSESGLWRTRVKGACLDYCANVINEDPYNVPGAGLTDPNLNKQYHDARVRVAQQCQMSPDSFAMQNAAAVAIPMVDPIAADDLALLGSVINLWKQLAGGIPVPPPATTFAGAPVPSGPMMPGG
jgi:hypothetical protein